MDDFNNNTPSGNEQQNTPESTGNFRSAARKPAMTLKE